MKRSFFGPFGTAGNYRTRSLEKTVQEQEKKPIQAISGPLGPGFISHYKNERSLDNKGNPKMTLRHYLGLIKVNYRTLNILTIIVILV
jgi:hypothetical protein